MKYPWANGALIVFLVGLVSSGFLGLKNGFDGRGWLLWIHSGAAYGLLILFFWKGVVIADAWRRKKRWTASRLGFLIMLVLLVGVLALGLGWTFAGPIYWFGFSLVSLHIYLAVPVLLLAVWHGWRMRFIFRVDGATGRRLFLGSAVPAVLGAGLWRAGVRLQPRLNPAGSSQRFTGSYLWARPPGRFPVTSWIFDYPPPVDPAGWRLSVDGAVREPRVFRLDDWPNLPQVDQEVLLDCTSGWYTVQRWRGVRLGVLLDAAGIEPAAASVTVRAVSGYQRRFPLGEARQFLLATGVAGRSLSHGHGFPLRLVAPGRRGFEWVKWINRIEVNVTPSWWQPPLPLR